MLGKIEARPSETSAADDVATDAPIIGSPIVARATRAQCEAGSPARATTRTGFVWGGAKVAMEAAAGVNGFGRVVSVGRDRHGSMTRWARSEGLVGNG